MKKWASLLVVAVVFLTAPNLWAQCAIKATATATFNAATNTTFFTYNIVTAGDTITVALEANSAIATSTVTDNTGSHYTIDAFDNTDPNGCGIARYHLFNASPGITSIRVNNRGNGGVFTITEFSGGSNATDVAVPRPTPSANATTGWITPLSGTLAQANEIVFGDVGDCGGAATLSSGPNAGYTPVAPTVDNSTNWSMLSAYLLTSATTSTQTKFTMTGSRVYGSVTDSYECQSAAAPTSGGYLIPIGGTPSPSPEEILGEASVE